jgi:hypothetical protein
MPMDSVSEENIKKILKEKENKELELSLLMKKSIQQIWLEELDTLKEKYIVFKQEKNTVITSIKIVKKPKIKKI